MWASKNNNRCKQLRVMLGNSPAPIPDRRWIQDHVADCPRCRRRLADNAKVELALTLLKSRAHALDLLMRANTQAVGVLHRRLRTTAAAGRLKKMRPEPNLLERCGKYKQPLVQAAACIAIAVAMKSGTFSSAEKLHADGRKAVERYYAAQVGEDLAREIFGARA